MERVVLRGADFEDERHVHRVVAESWQDCEMVATGEPTGEPVFAMVGLGSVRIAEMDPGGPVEASTDHTGAYGVTAPLSGHFVTRFGREVVDSQVDQATLNAAGTDLVIPDWSIPVFCFRVEQVYLEAQYERVLARPFRRLPLQLDLETPAGRDWHRLVRAYYEQLLSSESALFEDPVFAEQLASTMTTGLLLAAAPEDRSDLRGTHPRTISRVVEAIAQDPAHPWTAVELAELAGVSVRRLQQGFRETLGLSPFEHLRDVRLDRAHHDLVHAAEGESVTDIALRYGLQHGGRFAADYRRRFGRLPSATLHAR